MLTSIGRFLRKLRIDNGEILKDMAEALGVSSAFLSAVENGKKKMPEGWVEKLKAIYSFTAEQAEELQVAVIDTNEAVELNLQNATPGNRALAISFAREFDSLDDETSRKIFEILKRHKHLLLSLHKILSTTFSFPKISLHPTTLDSEWNYYPLAVHRLYSIWHTGRLSV